MGIIQIAGLMDKIAKIVCSEEVVRAGHEQVGAVHRGVVADPRPPPPTPPPLDASTYEQALAMDAVGQLEGSC